MTVEQNLLLGRHTAHPQRHDQLAACCCPDSGARKGNCAPTRPRCCNGWTCWHGATPIAGELAYGDQRRIEIIRALAADPLLLLLDEPSAGMNEARPSSLAASSSTCATRAITILIIEHDMNLISQVCDQVVVLNFGQVISQGTPQQVQSDPLVIEAYLGQEDE